MWRSDVAETPMVRKTERIRWYLRASQSQRCRFVRESTIHLNPPTGVKTITAMLVQLKPARTKQRGTSIKQSTKTKSVPAQLNLVKKYYDSQSFVVIWGKTYFIRKDRNKKSTSDTKQERSLQLKNLWTDLMKLLYLTNFKRKWRKENWKWTKNLWLTLTNIYCFFAFFWDAKTSFW